MYFETVGADMGFIGEVLGWTDLSPRQRFVVVVRIALLLVTISGLLVLAWIVPTWQTGSVIPRTQIEFVKTMAQMILGTLVFGTLWVAWRRANAADRTADAAQRTAEASQQTVRVAQDGQITERFTKAVEQLGNRESMAIRLGGIYALERIAKDSEKDHWQVMEVLTAHLRANNWWKGQPYQQRESDYYQIYIFAGVPMPTDIQAIMSVLRRRDFRREGPEQRIDLGGTSLLGANLEGANLSGAILIDADLRRANLGNANLKNADLSSAIVDLAPQVSPGTDLTDSNLRGTNLQNADLRYAKFGGGTFVDANFQEADLRYVDLRYANLTQEQVDSAITDETTKLPRHLAGSQNP